MLNGQEVVQVGTFKYLSLIIDQHLNFESQMNKLIGKVKQRTGLLRRVRNCISKSLAKQLYISLIDPHSSHCTYIYDACTLDSKRKLQVSQNKAITGVLAVGNRYPTDKLHTESEIKWLGVTRAKMPCTEIYKYLLNKGLRL